MQDDSDEQLMIRYQEDDLKAFGVLYERLSPRVYAYFRKRVSSSEVVDELFQMVFMKLHQTRHTYDPKFKVLPWMYAICRTTVADAARKGSVLVNNSNEPITEKNLEALVMPEVATEGLNLSGLDENQEKVVRMHLEEDLSFNEIAKRLTLRPDAVRQRFSRAIKKLRTTFSKSEGT